MTGTLNTNILQNLIINLLKQSHVDVVRFESLSVLNEIEPLEPFTNTAHAANSSSSAFACFNSGVSMPS